MIFVKSILAGMGSVVVAAFLAAIGMIVYLALQSRNMPEGTAIGWDPVSFVRQSVLVWIFFAATFTLGFLWEWRRAR